MPTANGLSDRLSDTFEAIDAAGLGLEPWPAVLERVRDLIGSRVAQLQGIGRTTAPFAWSSVADPEEWRDLVEVRGIDPQVNSRRRASLAAPLMALQDEADFDTEADGLKHPAYGDFLRRRDYPYVCLAPVVRFPDATVNFSITRSAVQGGLNAEGKRLFTAVAGRVRHAVKTQEALQARTLERLVATLDQMAQTVFACGGDGKVLACTPAGEALLVAGDRLALASGRLTARSRDAANWLSDAIARGCGDLAIIGSSRIVCDARGERPLVLEVVPVPAQGLDIWRYRAVLVMARELDAARAAGRLARLGAATMGFTPAEEAVARDLLAGRSPTETAEALGITVGTVRTHVKRIYAKAGVHNQLAFAALMGALR